MKLKHIVIDKIIYGILKTFFNTAAHISFFIYQLNNNNINKKFKISVPAVNTIGDVLEHIEYFRLLKNINKDYKLLLIDEFPANVYCKFLLPKSNFEFYSESLYIFLLKIINKIPSKNGYLKRIFNHIFLTKLRVKLSEINFYRKEKINKKILSKLKKKNYSNYFINAFYNFNYKFSKSNQKFEVETLRNKFGYQKLSQKKGYNKKNDKYLLQKLRLKKKNYICLNIRAENGKNVRDSIKLFNYEKVIDYLLKKNLSIVLTGSKNQKIKKYFLNDSRVVDYRNSECQNLVNDFYIIGNSKFVISQISGPIVMAISMNIPILILDAATIEEGQLYRKILYLPKLIKHKKNKKKINNYFKNSMIFADQNFDKEKYIAIENSKEKKLKCLKIFMSLLEKKDFKIPKKNSIEAISCIDKDIQRISYANRKRIFTV